ncbi:MAG: hypothetical protein HW373_1776 [Deltaproteobacteria bacterium]|nr:hypothetical protein [Deltaproteobacteria bacterium]
MADIFALRHDQLPASVADQRQRQRREKAVGRDVQHREGLDFTFFARRAFCGFGFTLGPGPRRRGRPVISHLNAVGALQYRNQIIRAQTAGALRQGPLRLALELDLPFSPHSQRYFNDLRHAGRADRMAARLQPPGRIDRQRAVHGSFPFLDRLPAFARRKKSQVLRADDLKRREGVVDLGKVDLFRRNAGHLIGALGCRLGRAEAGKRLPLAQTHGPGPMADARDEEVGFLRRYDHRGGAVRHRRAIIEPERRRDKLARKIGLRGDRFLKLGERVQRTVQVIFHRNERLALLPLDHLGQDARRCAGAQMGHLLPAQDQHVAIVARCDRLTGRVQRRRAGGRGRLDS